MMADTFAIVVTFHPTHDRLKRLVTSLLAARLKVIVVDNTPSPLDSDLLQSCNIITMGDNYGIAQAQNIGIRKAREEGAEIIAFFDQDSTIQPGLVERLISLIDPKKPQVVGAVYIDDRKGFECPSYKLNRFGYPTKIYTDGRTTPFPVDVRISSGSVVTAVTFDIVGLMDDGLFLDYVDIEWCLRARAKGVPIMIDPLASMRHNIGDKTVEVGNLRVFVDSPTRTYYRMRNALLLARKRDVPFLFVSKEVTSELLHHFLQIILVESKVQRLRAYILGVWHGLRGVIGRKA
jgi:rhamnosyltransferase